MDFDDYEKNSREVSQATPHMPPRNEATELTPEVLRGNARGEYFLLADDRCDMVTVRYPDADGQLQIASLQYAVNSVITYSKGVITATFMDKCLIIDGSALDPIYTGLATRRLMMIYASLNTLEERQHIKPGQTFVSRIDCADLNAPQDDIPSM